ncbi:MAG: NAAT family transporter [Thermoplasmata archaeon]|nr:NAAT family transporter [Thermoplasmata archaeon]
MDFNITLMIAAFAAIFITINPISKVPFFILLTQGYTREQQKKVILNAVKVSLSVLIPFALFGKYLFDAFNVEFLALKFVGAAVLIKIGSDMLMGQIPQFKSSQEEKDEAIEKGMVGVVPLAIPMMAGPGAMITAMIYMGQSVNVLEWGFIVFCLVITILITYILLMESQYIYEKMGNLGITATMRIMGILIASIGVQMMLNNILQFAELF